MSPIKDFRLIYEPLNEENFFSEGDAVTGTVSFTLSKETKVNSLFVKVKCDSRVMWGEEFGDNIVVFKGKQRYFKDKDYLVEAKGKGTVLPKGVHRFNFRLQIPQGDMPSSFKGTHGKIEYMLEAKLSRSWRRRITVKKKLNFVSKSLSFRGQIVAPCSESVQKKIGVFFPRRVQMLATVDRPVCSPGDTLSIVAKIHNSSSKKMKLRVILQQNIVYYVKRYSKPCCQKLCKMVGDTIRRKSEETVSCQLTIPDDVIYTINNCDIISVQYNLKVYLDISFATDPEVVLPLVIVPRSFAPLHPDEALQVLSI